MEIILSKNNDHDIIIIIIIIISLKLFIRMKKPHIEG